MTIQELFIRSNEMEERVVAQIGHGQWKLLLPDKVTHRPMNLEEAVRFHTWDAAWIPDGLAGKALSEIGNVHDHLLKLPSAELKREFARYTRQAIEAVRNLDDLTTIVHLSYGDFSAREYLQHNIGVRAFWSYDMARLIHADFTMTDDLVEALLDEFSPVVEGYRQLGLFPPAVELTHAASAQARLLAMVGRE